MKKLLTILFLFLTTIVFSQTVSDTTYPKYYVVNGDTLGIIITLQQAQKLDNDEDILNLFKQMNVSIDSVDHSCIEVVDGLNNNIFLLNTEIKDLKSELQTSMEISSNLSQQVNNYQKDDSLCNNQSNLKDGIIKDQKKQMTKLKIQRDVGYVVGIVAVATIIYMAVTGK